MLYQDVGQGKLEALAHCLAGVWGRFHTVVCGVCTCESRQEERGEGEWLALGGGGGSGNGEGSSSWKKDSLGKKGGKEMERKSMQGRRQVEWEAGGMH